MLSIGEKARQSAHVGTDNAVGTPAGKRRVLPHMLRKPTRLFNRLLAGNALITTRGWGVLIVVMAIVGIAGAMTNSRQSHSVVANISSMMGFTLNGVKIDGIHELSEIDIISRLNLGQPKSLFLFDINHAREELLELSWVKDAVVAKTYPDKLTISITERQPFAIWQHENTLWMIERNGNTIDRFDKSFAGLPLLVGAGANMDGAQILYLVDKVSTLKGQVKAYSRIANRRWDLHLKNGTKVRLPEENPAAALKELEHLNDRYQIFARDLSVIDLRLSDRLVVTLNEQMDADFFPEAKSPIVTREEKI